MPPREPPDSGTASTVSSEGAAHAPTIASDGGASSGAASAIPSDSEALPIVDAGEWEIVGELARGGMGRVLRARDRRLRREVAIKEMLGETPEAIRRFEREILITARLQHPAIVTLHRAGRWPTGRPFYAMKLVSGTPLDKVIAEAKTFAQRLALLPSVRTAVEALAYAHGQAVIHRDLKPSNVLVGAFGETVVIDWGLAKDLTDSSPEAAEPATEKGPLATATGAVLGTPSYMPPEQASGGVVTERSDVYALGAMLYHLLAGKPPYEGASSAEVLGRVLVGPPEPLDARAPDAPAELLAITARALARDPADRYPTAREMADDLRRFETGQLVGTHRYSSWELVRRWARRHRAALVAGAAAITATAVIGAVAITQVVRERDRARAAEHSAQQAERLEQAQKEASQRTALESLEGQAAQALAAGEAMKAAAYLVPVYAAHPDDAGVQFLVARAVATIDPLDHTLAGHTDRVMSAAWSPDGARVVTASADRTARIWDASGALQRTLSGHTDIIDTATWTPDARRIVTAARDGSVRVWDATTGAVLATFDSKAATANLSADGARMVTAGADGAVRIWSLDHRRVAVTTPASFGTAWSAAFSSDGALVVAGYQDGAARVWDARTGALRATLKGHTGEVWWATFSPDGKHVVTGSLDHTARIWDTATGALQRTLTGHHDVVASVAYCADGNTILTAGFDGVIGLWDANTGSARGLLEGHRGPVKSARCDATGARVLSASYDGTARVWNMPASARLPIVRADGPLEMASFSPDGTWIATASDAGTAQVWDARTGAAVSRLKGHAKQVNTAVLTSDGRVITGSDDHTARIWDARTGAQVATIAAGESVLGAVASADGARFATVDAAGVLRLHDHGGAVVAKASVPDALHSVTWSPDGARLATSDDGGHARIWDANTAAKIADVGDKSAPLYWAAFSRDGTRVVSACLDNVARIRDVASGAVVLELHGHRGGVLSSVFSPDGALVLTSGADGTARVWDAQRGEMLAVLGDGVSSLFAAWSPDGTAALTASTDGSARVWDLRRETRTPAEIAALVAARVPYELRGGQLVQRH